MSRPDRKIVIIGSGPAGLTAAVYAARANLHPLLIEGFEAGGQLMLTTDVENYPGFVDGIMGPALMEQMRKQAARFGTEYLTQNVSSVDLSEHPFRIQAGDEEVTAATVVVATGAQAKMLEVPGEKELLGHGVSTCATCDGFFFTDKELAIVGGGDSAMEEATFLTKFASKVTVVHRRDSLRASKILQERAFQNPKIEFVWDSTITCISGNGKVDGVHVHNLKTRQEHDLSVDGVFVAIGHTPNTDLFKDALELNQDGYIKAGEEGTQTSVEGAFAAGDVVDFRYRQAITAAGMGCMAAIDAERYLDGIGMSH